MTNQDAPDRIWIEEDDGCPYFYDASELAEAGGPLIEYIRADLASTCAKNAQVAPAPVVPAEGLDALIAEIEFETVNSEIDRALAGRIITALRSAPPVEARVKPLVWEPCEAWKRCSKERAKAFGGEYQIVMLDPDDDPPLPSLYFEIGLGAFMFRFEQGPDPLGLPGETCPRTFPSVEAAKAAAQADYEARILAALLPAGDGEE